MRRRPREISPDEAGGTRDELHLVETGEGYRLERRERWQFQWGDVLIWLVVLVIAELLMG